MADIIKLLPDNVANQIAAGEVVQRPASVVKELLENAIDAGATKIKLIIKDAGKQLVHVIDNGKGMSETDARMCFERHATSKIQTSEDIFRLRTFGFRGEALASIAAVAQVELKTKLRDKELGTCVKIEGSVVLSQTTVAMEAGTSIAVKNIFYNVPARRNFLKTNLVESRHIQEEFFRAALAYPEIEFTFYQDDNEVYILRSEKLAHRIVNLFGDNYQKQLITCQEETPLVKIRGYVGKPEFARKTRGDQFFFVNRRFIKSSYLNHAVLFAYDELIGEGSYPFYVLNLEIDPSKIDINVHPTKTEIKFEDEKAIYSILRSTVKKALAQHNITPSIDYELNVNFGNEYSYKPAEHKTISYPNDFKKTETKNWEMLYENFDKQNDNNTMVEVKLQSNINKDYDSKMNKNLLLNDNTTTFQLHLRYIITQVRSGMVIIDQHLAHERILYEKYINMLQNKHVASQQFLFPQTIELPIPDFEMVVAMEEDFKSLGFVFSVFGKNTIVLNGIPADIANTIGPSLFEDLLEQFKRNQSELKIPQRENLARSLAKKSAITAGKKLTLTEMNSLIEQLFACSNPSYSPDGYPTLVLLTNESIEQMFLSK
ncbi:MAG: DNA mismatch repair endonuclease MutL [Cytophagaceae bacterium]|nr:DNA mismatch repair endonuclease MutL [Cytophagaceae bacterium]MDW8456277.1 DNA mismatch repair endonuclease MutL [Cytophagaceae bacterium]